MSHPDEIEPATPDERETMLLDHILAIGRRRYDASSRLGHDAPRCTSCGEADPLALSRTGEDEVFCCYECGAVAAGRAVVEQHHIAGRHNAPDVTAPVRANTHRALSEAQRDWPTGTMRNPTGSPLVAVAGLIRGVIDYFVEFLLRIIDVPSRLERLNDRLVEQCGPTWWTALGAGGTS